MKLNVEYNAHFCSFFGNNSSGWKLRISDWLKQDMGDDLLLTVDEMPVSFNQTPHEINIPASIGENHISTSKIN